MTDWNETLGMVSRAFDLWMLDQKDIRAFMRLSLRFARDAYERISNELGAAPPEDDFDELPDAFHRAVEGLWPQDFEWMLLSAVVKDAVSGFEVYLERAAEEVLEHHRLPLKRKDPEKSLDWRELKTFYSTYLGVAVDSVEVKRIRALRHILTHQRGELRTDKQRKRFQVPDDFMAIEATLREDDIEGHLAALEGEVRRIDPTVYRFSWGGDRIPELPPPQHESGSSGVPGLGQGRQTKVGLDRAWRDGEGSD